MRRARKTADIDVTPLLDVMFMLIIFFVLTTAFVQGSLAVDLPDGDAPASESRNPVIVTVSGDALLWAGREITRDELAPLAAKAVSDDADVWVAGAESSRYGDVAELLNELRVMGVKDVSLAFEGQER